MTSIPVLMYHHILPQNGFVTSSIEEFTDQMAYLANNHWHTLTSNEFLQYKLGLYNPPKKSVFITFDDGWKDNYIYAYPILKRFGLKATLFIVTEWIEKASEKKSNNFILLDHKQYKSSVIENVEEVILSWDDIEKMSDVFDFHSHTHTHRDNYFSSQSWENELIYSRNIIKIRLGFEDLHLCWPRGKYDELLIKQAQDIGYKILYTTKRGVNISDNNTTEIKRIATKKSLAWIRKILFLYSNSHLGTVHSFLKK